MWRPKRIFAISRLLKGVFVLVPVSLALIYYGFLGLPFTLEKNNGYIEKMYSSNNTFYVRLNSVDIFQTSEKEKINILKKNLKIGQEICLYSRKGKIKIIDEVEINDKIILEYKISIFDALILFIGICLLTLVIYYLFKSPEDLWGEDKGEMDDFLDPWKKYKEK
jgi:hypothetical protein